MMYNSTYFPRSSTGLNELFSLANFCRSNFDGYRYSKSAIIRGQKLGQIVVRYLTSIHQFYDSTTFQLRHQSFDNRLNDKPQVGTPIRRSLLHTNQYQVFDPYSHWLLPSFILLTFELTSITEI